MKVQFEFSAADLADVMQRSANRSKTVRRLRWQARAVYATVLSAALFFIIPGEVAARAAFALLAWIGIVVLSSLLFKSSHERYLQYSREQLGGDGPFTCEVEMTAEGVATIQCGVETRRTWAGVRDVVVAPGGIEFVWQVGGLMVVRDRAFGNPQARTEFLQLAREYLAAVPKVHDET